MTRPAPPCPECGGVRYWYAKVEFWVGGVQTRDDRFDAAVCGECGYSSLYLLNMARLRKALPRMGVLADLLAIFAPGEPELHWPGVAERLARRFPDRWADATADAVSAQCRDLGVPSVRVRIAGTSLRGCRRDDLDRAASRWP